MPASTTSALARVDGRGDGARHLQLLAPLGVLRIGRGERAAVGQRRVRRALQRAHAHRRRGVGTRRRRAAHAGSRRIELGFEAGDLVAQQQAALLQPAQQQFVAGGVDGRAVDQAVEVGMLDAQLDQAARQGVQVVVH